MFNPSLIFLLFYILLNIFQIIVQNIKIRIYSLQFMYFLLTRLQVDLEDVRSVSSTKAKEMAAELGIQYYETSAATGQGVEEAVEALLTLVMARIERSLEEERRKVLSQQSQHTRKLSMRSVRVSEIIHEIV